MKSYDFCMALSKVHPLAPYSLNIQCNRKLHVAIMLLHTKSLNIPQIAVVEDYESILQTLWLPRAHQSRLSSVARERRRSWYDM